MDGFTGSSQEGFRFNSKIDGTRVSTYVDDNYCEVVATYIGEDDHEKMFGVKSDGKRIEGFGLKLEITVEDRAVKRFRTALLSGGRGLPERHFRLLEGLFDKIDKL